MDLRGSCRLRARSSSRDCSAQPGCAHTACSSFSGDAEIEEAGTDAGSPDGAVEVATDPFHCGRCGHSCLGGDGVAGQCKPFLIGSSTGEFLGDVAVDDQRVLWTTSAYLLTAPATSIPVRRRGATARPSRWLLPARSREPRRRRERGVRQLRLRPSEDAARHRHRRAGADSPDAEGRRPLGEAG